MEIHKKDNKFIIEIPAKKKRSNPYNDMAGVETKGEYDTLTGLIIHYEGYTEYGFANTLDMNFKGKCDQFTKILYYYSPKSRKDFIDKCGELGIKVAEYNEGDI